MNLTRRWILYIHARAVRPSRLCHLLPAVQTAVRSTCRSTRWGFLLDVLWFAKDPNQWDWLSRSTWCVICPPNPHGGDAGVQRKRICRQRLVVRLGVSWIGTSTFLTGIRLQVSRLSESFLGACVSLRQGGFSLALVWTCSFKTPPSLWLRDGFLVAAL